MKLKMPEVSKKRNKSKHLIQLWVSEEKYQQLKLVANSVEEPVTMWVRRAVFAALRKWEIPQVTKEAFPKCSMCGKHHNQDEHFAKEA